jgi:hypothetical protein
MRLRMLFFLCSGWICYGQAIPSIDVFYTGRLLGYFRYPDRQDFSRHTCPTDTNELNKAGAALKKIWDERLGKAAAARVLVGMGDNFAPEFFSRTFVGKPSSPADVPYPAKDRYVWDTVGGNWVADDQQPPAADKEIPTDNVACFLELMGYTALVPGKHDFYFGPNRLRELGWLLHDKHIQLLAGNLSITTSVPEARPRLPLHEVQHELDERQKRNPSGLPYTVIPIIDEDEPPPAVKLPDVVLPYLRRFDVDNAYYLRNGSRREIVADRSDQVPVKMYRSVAPPDADHPHPPDCMVDRLKPDCWVNPTAEQILKSAPQLSYYAYDEKHLTAYRDAALAAHARVLELQICENRTDPGVANPKCWKIPASPEAEASDYKTSRMSFLAPNEFLLPDRNYAACLLGGNDKKYHCQPFYVATPFFYKAEEDTNPAPTAPVKPRDPYAFTPPTSAPSSTFPGPSGKPGYDDPFVVRITGGVTVAVFGLLDPDEQANIGRLNYTWWNDKKENETSAQISSPTDALSQALMRFELRYPNPDERKKMRPILLAQMSSAKAAQLLGNVQKPRFELVVAETDPSNATPDAKAKRTLDDDKASPRFVVVPDQMYSNTTKPGAPPDSPGSLKLQIRKATVERVSPKTWNLTHDIKQENTTIGEDDYTYFLPRIVPPGDCPAQDTLRNLVTKTLLKRQVDPNPNWSASQLLSRLALLVMQDDPRHHADISLLQSRDIFRPEVVADAPASKCDVQELLERVFWKGDFVVRVPITGATLTSILKASDTFTTLESSPTNIDIEKGRSLVTLGVFKEGADQNLTVNGVIVDPARAYSVSMTDYLALADTGYTDLKTPIVPYPYRVLDFEKLDAISAMVCRAIRDAVLPDAQCYRKTDEASSHLDISKALPSDQTRGQDAWYQFKSYLSLPSRWSRFNEFYNSQNTVEKASADKHYWSLDLEKADFGLNMAYPYSASALKSEFTGITTAPVTAPRSYTITFDDRIRLKFSTPKLDWFLQQESNYSYARTGGTSFTRNLSLNTLAGETGYLYHASWRDRKGKYLRRPQEIDLLASVRLETAVQAPRLDTTVNSSLTAGDLASFGQVWSSPLAGSPLSTRMSSPSTLLGAIRRPVDIFAKFGVRFSDERSWIEAGYMAGRSLVNPYSIEFSNGLQPVGNALLIPGQSTLVANPAAANNATLAPYLVPSQYAPLANWVKYWSTPLDVTPPANTLVSSSSFYATYTGRPISGFFLNFSANIPLPLGNRYADWSGGKPIAFQLENSGRYLYDFSGDIATQTKWLDTLAWSLVFPALGNLSIKPEIDLTLFRNKSQAGLAQQTSYPFQGLTYKMTFAYTFSWRQGQDWKRIWRFASPAPTQSVPVSGR